MNFKKLILTLFLTTITMFSLLIGFSYAWYATASPTQIDITTASRGDIKTNFETTEYITTKTGVPIVDADIAISAAKNKFSINASENMALRSNYTISIAEISMDQELKTGDFKWQLLKNNSEVARGDFSDIGDNTTKELYTTGLTLNSNAIDNYELRIWLRENGNDQNSLMNKSFRARVTVKTVLIK